MAKGFTPLIGLAVVVALALAAVFGSMSLANPAMAAVGQPADAELTERAFSPQVAMPMNLRQMVVAPAEAGDLTLTWDNIAAGKFYQTQRRLSGGDWTPWPTGTTAALAANTTSMVLGGFTPGTTYEVRVREVENGDANAPGGPASNIVTVNYTAQPNPPTKRTPEVAEAAERGIRIGWLVGAPVSNGVITKWQYQTAADGDWMDMGMGNPTLNEYTIPNLNTNEGLIVNLRAVSGYAASTTLELIKDAIVPEPAKPTGLTAMAAGDGEVMLEWDVTNDTGVYGYEYRYRMGTGNYVAETVVQDPVVASSQANSVKETAAVTMETVSGLTNMTEHSFQVRALSATTDAITTATGGVDFGAEGGAAFVAPAANARQESGWTDAVMATPIAPTPAILAEGGIPDMTVAPGASLDLNLGMYFTDGDGAGDIDNYTVTWADDSNITVSGLNAEGMTDSGRITISGIKDGFAYITVVADDGVTGDNPSDIFKVTVDDMAPTVDVPAPNMPSGLSYSDMTAYDAADNGGSVMVSWGDPFDDRITRWQYSYMQDADGADVWMTIFSSRARSATLSGLMVGTKYTVKVRALVGTVEGAVGMVTFTPAKADAPAVPPGDFEPALQLASTNPGKNTAYTIRFNAAQSFTPGVNDIVVQFTDGDWIVPGTINESSVIIDVNRGADVANPASVTVDDQEITLELQDMDGDEDGVQGIRMGDNVTIIFRTSAGITNPLEGGGYGDMTVAGIALPDVTIKRTISLAEEEGGRGTMETVTGKGFKNGTTVTFLRMESDGLKDADFALGTSLCTATASDGIASCGFTITSPLFRPGDNFINAFDGRSNKGTASEPFNLEPSIGVSPSNGSPGESILVNMYDFPSGATVSEVKIARRTLCSNGTLAAGTDCGTISKWLPGAGTSFRVVIPNNAPLGVQDLQVLTNHGNDNTNITISGPVVTSNPTTVLANQRVSLVGTGFSPGSTIRSITFAGHAIDSTRIAGGNPVRVDGGGNWNASVNLPLNTSTVSSGEHTVQVEDLGGRIGALKVTVPERKVTIAPPAGRVGTIALISGENFPSKNDDGTSFNVEIVYGSSGSGTTTVSAVPDASGRFEVQLRIPTSSAIPSTNDVTVRFGTSAQGGPFTLNVSHEVPEGVITLSVTSGGPGSTITINGEGFRSFVPVQSVMIGSIDITPTPRPSTDLNGMINFDVLIPGLDVGIQTIEVQVGSTTASAGFTVTESGIAAGDITRVASALEPLGDNLVSVWHFNNDTKVWSFYDPTLTEGNTLTHMITGETYLIRVTSSQEVILNRNTRSLTCVGGNCWNQVVW